MDNLIFRVSLLEGGVVFLIWLLVSAFIFTSQRSPRTGGNSLALWMKLLATLLICFLLLKPEIKRELPQDKKLQLLVLKDETPSMQAVDVSLDGEEVSRAGAVSAFLESAEWLAFLETTDFQVIEQAIGTEVQETNLAQALELGMESSAVLLLSDGAWNAGASPVGMAQRLRKEMVSAFSLGIGEEVPLPDLILEKGEAPFIVETEEVFALTARLTSTFPSPQVADVILRLGEDVLAEKRVDLMPQRPQELTFTQELSQEGAQALSLEVRAVEGEATLQNNAQDYLITARRQELKVLLIDTLPRWEYRYIRNAMMRDEKVDVSCLLLHPDLAPGGGPSYIQSFPEDLSPYDVILLGDIGIAENQLSTENAEQIAQAVQKNATGLMLLPGKMGWQETFWENPACRALYPVEQVDEFGGVERSHLAGLTLSQDGERSLLLALSADERRNAKIWESLPGFAWYQPVSGIKSGSTVLAYHESERNKNGRIPLIVTGKVGRGKVLWMGMDSSWKWRRGVEDLYHYRFWRQVARWMAYQRNLTEGEQAKIFLSAESPLQDSTLNFSLHAMTEEGKPAQLDQLKFIASFPSGAETLIPLIPTKNWGEFKGRLTLPESGAVTLRAEVNGKEVGKREIQVTPKTLETIGEPADLSSLGEIARLTRAVSLPYSQRTELLPHLTQASNPPPRYEFLSLNTHWAWYLSIVLLLSASWIMRRRATGAD